MSAGSGTAVLTGQGCHVEDAPETRLRHVGTHDLTSKKDAPQIQSHDRIKLFGRNLHERRRLGHSRVIDQDVYCAPLAQDGTKAFLKSRLARNVQFDRERALTRGIQFDRSRFGALVIAIADGDAIASLEEPFSDDKSEPLGGAGDQSNLFHFMLLDDVSDTGEGVVAVNHADQLAIDLEAVSTALELEHHIGG